MENLQKRGFQLHFKIFSRHLIIIVCFFVFNVINFYTDVFKYEIEVRDRLVPRKSILAGG